MVPILDEEEIAREVRFRASRSSGKGGQNVNKVSTRVEALLDIRSAACFSAEQREVLLEKLATRLSREGILQVSSEEERSQYLNKERAFRKMIALLEKALRPVRPRKATRPRRNAVEKRLEEKRLQALKKQERRKPF